MKYFGKVHITVLFLATFYLVSGVVYAQKDINLSDSDTLCIATYNVRIRTIADTGPRNWKKRKNQVADLIKNHHFDLFGVQELDGLRQENDLKKLLKEYDHISRGRDDNAGKRGERLAIFYDKDRFELLNSGHFFLSETPDTVSKGWDAALKRICLWGKFHDNKTQHNFYFFNVHFDHAGFIARKESAKLLIKKVKQIADNDTIFCAGDFNASTTESSIYNTMTSYLADSRETSDKSPTGPEGTYNNWDVNSQKFGENVKIDYIFVRNIHTRTYSVIQDRFCTTNYPSDHFPVMIKCTF
ncbi:MAG: endonuclease/exonuclease/phosphatase family protein [Paludibacter sp.]|nr:endonuclease/exonuclease/phosphatase family protein [Paludibacter sp.]